MRWGAARGGGGGVPCAYVVCTHQIAMSVPMEYDTGETHFAMHINNTLRTKSEDAMLYRIMMGALTGH